MKVNKFEREELGVLCCYYGYVKQQKRETNMAAALRGFYDNSNMFLQDGSTSPLPKPYLPSIPPAKTRRKSYSRYAKP